MVTLEMIAAERLRVADVVDSLDDAQRATQSLCGAWTVHDVSAHLLMPLVTPVWRLAGVMAASGFNFDKANVKLTAAVASRAPVQIAAGLREHAESRFRPPGQPHEAPLADILVHGQDLGRPLGMEYVPEAERLRPALDYLSSGKSSGFVPKGVLAGLRYEASDSDFTCGTGPVVRGRGIDLLLAFTGRPIVLDGLEGDGVAALRERIG